MVTVDPDVLQADNLTLTDVVSAISPNNVRLPGGIVYQPGRETELDIRGDLPDPQSVAKLPIHVAYAATSGGTPSGTTTRTGGAGAGTATSSGGTGSAVTNETAAGNRGRAASNRITTRPSATVPPDVLAAAAAASVVPRATISLAPGATPAATPPAMTGGGMVPAERTSAAPSNINGSTQGSAGGATAAGDLYAGPPPPAAQRTSNTAAASASVPVDQPVNPPSLTSNNAQLSANAAPAMPAVSSNAYGSGAGTSMSPFVGTLAPWSVPSADKRIGDIATVTSSSVV